MTTLHTFRRLFLGEITQKLQQKCAVTVTEETDGLNIHSLEVWFPIPVESKQLKLPNGSSSHDQTSLTPLTTLPPPTGSSGREDKAPEPDKLKLNVAKGVCHHPRPVNTANKRLLKIPHFGTMATRSLSLQVYFKFESLLVIVK